MATTDVPPRPPDRVAGQPDAGRPQRWVSVGLVIATIVLGLGIIAVIPWLRHAFLLCVHGNVSGLRTYIRGLGVGGVALIVGLMLVHAVIYYPTELVTATAGFVYGWELGFLIALGGWLLSGLLSYALGRRLAGPLLRSLLGRRYTEFERAIERGGIRLLLAYRLLPIVPFSFMGYAAGAVGTSLWTFSWTTVVGFIPETLVVTYLGSRAQSLSLTSPIVWVAVAAAIALVVVGHRLQARHPAR